MSDILELLDRPTAATITPDFTSCVLWPTWRERKTGQPFDEWLKANGARLARLHDERSLRKIAECRTVLEAPVADVHGEIKHMEAKLEISIAESRLSNRYGLDKSERQDGTSYFVIEE